MIVLTCPDCESTKLRRYEGKMTDKGYDWFKCEPCDKSFPMKKASYREENDIFE